MRRMPNFLPLRASQLPGQIFPQDFDALWQRTLRGRYPVDSAKRDGPIRQQSLKQIGLECFAQEKFRQNTEAGACNQRRHHRITIVHAKRTRGPLAGRLAPLREAPDLRGHGVAVANAAVLCEVERMSRSPMFVEVSGCADQVARHSRCTRSEAPGWTAMRIAVSKPSPITSVVASFKCRSIDISGKAARNSGSSGATCITPKDTGAARRTRPRGALTWARATSSAASSRGDRANFWLSFPHPGSS
jgi:hypothetical protein